jgi:hypothetical protein
MEAGVVAPDVSNGAKMRAAARSAREITWSSLLSYMRNRASQQGIRERTWESMKVSRTYALRQAGDPRDLVGYVIAAGG